MRVPAIIGVTVLSMDSSVIVVVVPMTHVLPAQSFQRSPGLVLVTTLKMVMLMSFLIETAVGKVAVAGVSATIVKEKNPHTFLQKAETITGVWAWKMTSRHIAH
jgi:hypothetical protein